MQIYNDSIQTFLFQGQLLFQQLLQIPAYKKRYGPLQPLLKSTYQLSYPPLKHNKTYETDLKKDEIAVYQKYQYLHSLALRIMPFNLF